MISNPKKLLDKIDLIASKLDSFLDNPEENNKVLDEIFHLIECFAEGLLILLKDTVSKEALKDLIRSTSPLIKGYAQLMKGYISLIVSVESVGEKMESSFEIAKEVIPLESLAYFGLMSQSVNKIGEMLADKFKTLDDDDVNNDEEEDQTNLD